MKIIEIIYNLSSGGAERFVVDLSNQLAKSNEVMIFTLRNDNIIENIFYKNELSTKVKYRNMKVPCGLSFTSLIRLYKVIKNEKPNVVHFHISNIIFYFILPIIFYRKCKYFQTQHIDVSMVGKEGWLFFYIRKFFYKHNIVKTCAISKYNQKIMESTFSLKASKLILNGRKKCDTTKDCFLTAQEILSYKPNSASLCFLHIGRYSEQKNQELLIEAFNIYSEKNSDVLLIIGRGFYEKEADTLRKISNKSIYYLGEKHNVCDYLRFADAFCLSSRYEGMPITLIEAFSQGCIPISTPVSGAIDYIVDGESGFLSEDFTVNCYVKALERFKNNNHTIKRETLKSIYLKQFSIEQCAQNYQLWFTGKA